MPFFLCPSSGSRTTPAKPATTARPKCLAPEVKPSPAPFGRSRSTASRCLRNVGSPAMCVRPPLTAFVILLPELNAAYTDALTSDLVPWGA